MGFEDRKYTRKSTGSKRQLNPEDSRRNFQDSSSDPAVIYQEARVLKSHWYLHYEGGGLQHIKVKETYRSIYFTLCTRCLTMANTLEADCVNDNSPFVGGMPGVPIPNHTNDSLQGARQRRAVAEESIGVCFV